MPPRKNNGTYLIGEWGMGNFELLTPFFIINQRIADVFEPNQHLTAQAGA